MNIGEYEFPDDLYYDRNHFWAKEDDEGNVVFGATDFFQKLAGEIVFIELPMEGSEVSQGDTPASLESGKWVGKIFIPVSGKIVEVNEELEDSPELINESCYEEGWIAKIEPSDKDKDLANLLKAGDEFKAFLESEIKKHAK